MPVLVQTRVERYRVLADFPVGMSGTLQQGNTGSIAIPSNGVALIRVDASDTDIIGSHFVVTRTAYESDYEPAAPASP